MKMPSPFSIRGACHGKALLRPYPPVTTGRSRRRCLRANTRSRLQVMGERQWTVLQRSASNPLSVALRHAFVLSPEEWEAVLSFPTHRIDLHPRQDFVHINEEASYSCYVASGLVGSFAQNAEDLRQIAAFHIPGDVADLHSVVRLVGIGGLTALSNAVILRISMSRSASLPPATRRWRKPSGAIACSMRPFSCNGL